MIDFNDLNKFEFHDQTIRLLQVDFENKKILITVDYYTESIDDYLDFNFEFIGVSNFKMIDFEFDFLNELTISSFNLFENLNEYYAEFDLIDIKNFSAESKIYFKFLSVLYEYRK